MEIRKFKGLRNDTSRERFRPADLYTAYDVELDDTGRILTRKGKSQVSATALHSLHGFPSVAIAVNSSKQLVAIEPNFSLTTITTLSSSERLSACELAGVVFYSNNTDAGKLTGRTYTKWGVAPPVSQPSASATVVGGLPAGKYLYAMTFLRSDGYESGTGISGVVDLSTSGGIFFSNMEVSTNPDVTEKVIYLSGTNGELMYKALTLPNAVTTHSYNGTGLDLTIPLTTQFCQNAPAGYIVRIYNGTTYVVTGDTVYYSYPYEMELFSLSDNFMRFPGRVTLFEPVNDGIYVATEKQTWFISGETPDKFNSKELMSHGAQLHSGVATDATFFQSENAADPENRGADSGKAVVWCTTKGSVVVGYDGGRLEDLTEANFTVPVGQEAAGIVRRSRGYIQYLFSLRGPSNSNNYYTEEL